MEGIAINPHISCVSLTFPDMPKAGDGMKWDELEHRLLELNANQVPRLNLDFKSRECASDLLHLVLEGEVLSRLCALNRVAIVYNWQFSIRSQDIINTPTHHTIDDFTITLDTAQRIEWLLQSWPTNRKLYLDRLLETARARAQADGPKDEARTEAAVVEGPSERPLGEDRDGDRDGGRNEEGEGEGGRSSGEGSKDGKGDEGGEGDTRGRDDKDGDNGEGEGESASHAESNEPVGERGEQQDGQAEDKCET